MGTAFSVSRVTSQMQNASLLRNLTQQQLNMLKVNEQMSTKDRLSAASDDPAAAVAIERLDREISANTQYQTNLNYASGFLSVIDASLSSASDIVTQAQSIASSMVNSSVTDEERTNQASVVDSLLTSLMALANKQYQSTSIFGGTNGSKEVYASANGGYKFQGSDTPLSILTPSGSSLAYTTSAGSAFGGYSAQVTGYQNLSAGLSGNVTLTSLSGANGTGINRSTIQISDGVTNATVDLSACKTVQDVVSAINTAATANGWGSPAYVDATNGGISFTAGASALTVSDVDGTGASDLGIATTIAATPAADTVGGDLGAPSKITLTTPLSALNDGAGISGPGFTISNGTATANISLTGMSTVQDLLNAINYSGTNVNATINADGTGINIVNTVSGTEMRIAENGGTTADQLGIRSYTSSTLLADMNSGTGVTPISQSASGPSGTIVVTMSDGSKLNVDVTGVTTQSGLISAINTAAGYSLASANATGNGITLADTTGGSGNISVSAGNTYVSNGTNLGIFTTGSGNTLTGTDITFSTDDVRITKQDGTSFTVSFKGCNTVQDVLNAINNAGGNGGSVVADLNPNGNGIRLVDSSTGSSTFKVAAINSSQAGDDLGITGSASSSTPGEIDGEDTNGIMPESLFSTLVMLRNALTTGDQSAITRAGELLSQDSKRLISVQGFVGTQSQDVTNRLSQLTTDQTQLKTSRSLLADTDMTTAVTEYTALTNAYEATLAAAQMTQNLNLIDFLS